jgi:hypothetical protein
MNSTTPAMTGEPPPTIRQVREDYLRRQFGDEIARVSKLPLDERYRYVAWMIDNGRRHGVKNRREPRGVTI